MDSYLCTWEQNTNASVSCLFVAATNGGVFFSVYCITCIIWLFTFIRQCWFTLSSKHHMHVCLLTLSRYICSLLPYELHIQHAIFTVERSYALIIYTQASHISHFFTFLRQALLNVSVHTTCNIRQFTFIRLNSLITSIQASQYN